jgi:hypothetical protein
VPENPLPLDDCVVPGAERPKSTQEMSHPDNNRWPLELEYPWVLHLIASLAVGGTERQLVQLINRSSQPERHVVGPQLPKPERLGTKWGEMPGDGLRISAGIVSSNKPNVCIWGVQRRIPRDHAG